MVDIQFNEEQSFSSRVNTQRQSFLVRSVFKTGLVKTEKQAEFVLFIIVLVCIALAIVAPSFINKPDTTTYAPAPYRGVPPTK